MTPPTTSTSATASCPRCGAAVRAGSDWCTLCFADLRPVPPPRLTPEPLLAPGALPMAVAPAAAGPDLAGPDPAGKPGTVGTTLTVPASAPKRDAQLACPRCAQPVLLSVGVCSSCGAGLFDGLKAGVPTVKVPIFGDLMAMSKGARAGLAFGVAVVIVALLFVLVELLGKL